MHGGQLHRPNEEQGSERHIGNAGAGDNERICSEASRIDTSDTDSARQSTPNRESGREWEEMDGRSESITFDGFSRFGRHGFIADTSEQPGQRLRPRQSEVGRPQQEQPRGRGGEDGGVAGCGRWESFPIVSPIHRGNDGLPFPLDDLAIPASKWRTESLKAYGNAIVPQVMYEIFRAIEIVEQENL